MNAGDLSLLIIDDNPEDRYAIRVFLMDSGLTTGDIHEASSGRDGLAAIKKLRPDCVLLDYLLPDMDGIEVLAAIQDAAGDPEVPVIILTGTGDVSVAAAAIRAGAQDYLAKESIAAESLSWTVQAAINRFGLIRARGKAEQSLKVSEERLRLSQEVGEIGSWDWNITTGNLFWSPQQYRLYGLEDGADDPVSYDRWLSAVHPEDLEPLKAEVEGALIGAGPVATTFMFRIVLPPAKGGGVRWLSARGKVKHDSLGRPVRMVGVSVDITERHTNEQALRDLAEELEKRVAEEVTAREAANARLVHLQRMEALGQLAGGIAHDFNNVLQAVSGSLHLIEIRANDPDVVRRFAQLAAGAAARGATITNRLLAFSRAGDLRSGPVDPVSLLEGQREMLFHLLGASIALQVDAGCDLPPFWADNGQLETVLVNLAVNARDAMPQGGTLTLRAFADQVAEKTTHPAGLAAGEYIGLSVTDTGEGMDPATLARATEPFFTTKPAGKGTGLGLAMAHGFAQQSGGGFALRSAPGMGTTVTLWFPVSRQLSPPVNIATVATPALAAANILIVDDDPLVIEVLTDYLRDSGYRVIPALDGFAALARLDVDEAVDLLITDFAMPGMNGLELIRETQRRRPDLPVLLLTGYADPRMQADIDMGLPGKTHLLRKPISADALRDRVKSVLRKQ